MQYFFGIEYLKAARWSIIYEVSRMRLAADTTGMAENLFANYIKPILEKYQPVVSPLAGHYGDTLYRARKCIVDPFTNMVDLYNPPTPSGRAYTSDHRPILYASSSMQTCLVEVNPKIGELINIAQFSYTKIKNGNYWFVGQLSSFHRSREHSRYLDDESLVGKPSYYPAHSLHSWVFQDALFNEIFSELSSETDNYALNRSLIDEFRKLLPDQDLRGVVFMSVKDAPGTNFAIFDEAINLLEPRIVNLVRITDIDEYGFVAFTVLKNAKPKNGLLVWPDDVIQGA